MKVQGFGKKSNLENHHNANHWIDCAYNTKYFGFCGAWTLYYTKQHNDAIFTMCFSKLFYSAKAANSVLDRCQQLSPGDKIRGYTIEKVVINYMILSFCSFIVVLKLTWCDEALDSLNHNACQILQTVRNNISFQELWVNLLFLLFQVVPINELNLVSVLLNHDKTSAKHLHVAREDKNNVFS